MRNAYREMDGGAVIADRPESASVFRAPENPEPWSTAEPTSPPVPSTTIAMTVVEPSKSLLSAPPVVPTSIPTSLPPIVLDQEIQGVGATPAPPKFQAPSFDDSNMILGPTATPAPIGPKK